MGSCSFSLILPGLHVALVSRELDKDWWRIRAMQRSCRYQRWGCASVASVQEPFCVTYSEVNSITGSEAVWGARNLT